MNFIDSTMIFTYLDSRDTDYFGTTIWTIRTRFALFTYKTQKYHKKTSRSDQCELFWTDISKKRHKKFHRSITTYMIYCFFLPVRERVRHKLLCESHCKFIQLKVETRIEAGTMWKTRMWRKYLHILYTNLYIVCLYENTHIFVPCVYTHINVSSCEREMSSVLIMKKIWISKINPKNNNDSIVEVINGKKNCHRRPARHSGQYWYLSTRSCLSPFTMTCIFITQLMC